MPSEKHDINTRHAEVPLLLNYMCDKWPAYIQDYLWSYCCIYIPIFWTPCICHDYLWFYCCINWCFIPWSWCFSPFPLFYSLVQLSKPWQDISYMTRWCTQLSICGLRRHWQNVFLTHSQGQIWCQIFIFVYKIRRQINIQIGIFTFFCVNKNRKEHKLCGLSKKTYF